MTDEQNGKMQLLREMHDTILGMLAVGTEGSDEFKQGYKKGLEAYREYFYGPDSTLVNKIMGE